MAAAHVFVECGLGEGERLGQLFGIFFVASHQGFGGDGVLRFGEDDNALDCQRARGLLQVFERCVEILGVAGINQPYWLAAAKDTVDVVFTTTTAGLTKTVTVPAVVDPASVTPQNLTTGADPAGTDPAGAFPADADPAEAVPPAQR